MSTSSSETKLKQTAREHIQHAAAALSSLGPEAKRIAWMLEDSLMYLDELDHKEAARADDFSTSDTISASNAATLEALSKLVNS